MTTNETATEYINAAARCLYMRRLYQYDGSAKMEKRAETMAEKMQRHIEKAAELLSIGYDDAWAMVSERYRKVFL